MNPRKKGSIDAIGNTAPDPARSPGPLVSALRVVLPLIALASAGLLAYWLVKTEPRAKRRPAVRQAVLVQVVDVVFATEQVVIEAMGTVRAAQHVDMHPRVRGEVISMSQELVPGGLLKEGQPMLRIDPADYKLALQQSQASAVQAETSLQVELGSQSIAKKEYEMLGEVISDEDRDLVLRKPQLDKAKASVAAARAQVSQARLDLKRTTIKAPFNAVVRTRGVDVGTRVTESTRLATLVGTDAYWIEVSVPVDQLKWIPIPKVNGDAGAPVRIFDEAAWGKGMHRTGQVLRLAADLEAQGRMARLLVEVIDPLALKPEQAGKPQLLIGSYVRVEIEGSDLQSVVPVDRGLLRDGSQVWVMSPEGTLDIRQVETAFQTSDKVFVTAGIKPGEKLIKTDLATPVAGMALRTDSEPKQAKGKHP
ncbi:MAG: efflux RND transporter periplasmic adaptor subunit [Myxococcota bacterium]|nr:efflux RND transporter periplasmic adaptor subunit [Myxococcota bacterium]